MEATYVNPGMSVPYTATSALAAGQVIVQGQLVGVVPHPVESGQSCALAIQGVFDFNKATGAISVGALVYWDDTAKVATTTSTGNVLIGKCIRAAAASDSRVRVRLTP